MSNEILWLGYLFISLLTVTLLFRFYGKEGLIAWVVMNVILANLSVAKAITLFGLDVTLGNVAYGLLYLATDAISEFYGEREAKRTVNISFVCLLFFILFTQIVIGFVPGKEDFADPHFKGLFSVVPRFAVAGLVVFYISQFIDIKLYNFLKKKMPATRHLWIRNNGSTLISQFIDSFLFTLFGFYGLFPLSVIVQIFLFTYIIKIIVAICDTPFLYLMMRFTSQRFEEPDPNSG